MTRGQRIGLILAGLAVAVVAFILLKPGDDEDKGDKKATTTPTTVRTQTNAIPPPEPKPQYEVITVTGGKPEGGVKQIKLTKGDTARIEVDSDTADEIHVHGYDVMKDVEAGGKVRLKFKADIDGVFEIELEDAKVPLVKLVVEP